MDYTCGRCSPGIGCNRGLVLPTKANPIILQERFGPEYDRTVSDLDGRTKGESELKAREKPVGRLEILPLAPPEATRFSEAWQALQGRFVDSPNGVVVQAEQLVRERLRV
jgi:hypothetical protein